MDAPGSYSATGGRRPRHGVNRGAWKLPATGSLVLASWALGIFLIAEGNHQAAQALEGSVAAPWILWGLFFIALPFVIGAIAVLAAVVRAAAAEHQRYRAWKGHADVAGADGSRAGRGRGADRGCRCLA